MIKSTLIAATFACSMALPAVAGGLGDPIMEVDVIQVATSEASSGSTVLPIILFAMLVAIAASN